jgi:hypothetical protein
MAGIARSAVYRSQATDRTRPLADICAALKRPSLSRRKPTSYGSEECDPLLTAVRNTRRGPRSRPHFAIRDRALIERNCPERPLRGSDGSRTAAAAPTWRMGSRSGTSPPGLSPTTSSHPLSTSTPVASAYRARIQRPHLLVTTARLRLLSHRRRPQQSIFPAGGISRSSVTSSPSYSYQFAIGVPRE